MDIESAVRSALAGTPYQQLGPVDEGGGITIVVGGGGSFAEDMRAAKEKLTKAGLDAFEIGARIHVRYREPPRTPGIDPRAKWDEGLQFWL